MDRALTELAEATVGLNSELQWVLSEEITRRQLSPVFNRCASDGLSPAQALDACMDCVNAKLDYTMQVFDGLFTTLADRVTARYGDAHFPAMMQLHEFFMGLEPTTTEWSTSDRLAREELFPVFVRCSVGELSSNQALDIFVDNMVVKRDYTMEMIKNLVLRLAQEINNESTQPQVSAGEDDWDEQA